MLAKSLPKKQKFVNIPIDTYYFSSLNNEAIRQHRANTIGVSKNDTILVVGQYFDYRGMDIVLDVAKRDFSHKYKFWGMGIRTEWFLKEQSIPENVEIVPFLQREELEREYRKSAMLLLTSRKECWGLMINEAVSFDLPIVSTWGSGAAMEFLSEQYPQFLATPGDSESLLSAVKKCKSLDSETLGVYEKYLLEKSQEYSIEISVAALETMAR